jgi:hypothetical protein
MTTLQETLLAPETAPRLVAARHVKAALPALGALVRKYQA